MKNSSLIFSAVFVAIASLIVFNSIYYSSDLVLHANIATESLQSGKSLPVNFLYYKLIIFSSKIFSIKMASILILSLFVVLKFYVTYIYISSGAYSEVEDEKFALIATAVLFISPIYILQVLFFNRFYIRSFPSNIWHNSTIIASTPFAVLLFWQSCKQLRSWTALGFLNILLLVSLIALLKPSYIFVYILAFPLTALVVKKYFLKAAGVSIFSGA